MRKWSSEENVSGMSLFGSSWFKLDWEELKSFFFFFFWTADCGFFPAVHKAKEVQINKCKQASGGLFETCLHQVFERCVVHHWHIHWGNYSCISLHTNVPLQQMFLSCQRLLSSFRTNTKPFWSLFSQQKKLEDGIFEMPMRKIWKRNSYFCKPAYVAWANPHFFWWVELPAMHARQVLDLIRVPWASSAPNPIVRKKRARTTFVLGKGQQKAVRTCMETWISLWKWNPLFTAKFHLQWISITCD